MDSALLKKAISKCPYLAKTPVEKLRKLATMPSSRAKELTQLELRGANALVTLAYRKCPAMKNAMKIQSAALSSSATQRISKSAKNHAMPGPSIGNEMFFNGEHFASQGIFSISLLATPSHVGQPSGSFNYEEFYAAELDRKKKDRSYRVFNNINRLAQQFPLAHTGSGDHVAVWCSNDYLGMGKHPEVLEAMK